MKSIEEKQRFVELRATARATNRTTARDGKTNGRTRTNATRTTTSINVN